MWDLNSTASAAASAAGDGGEEDNRNLGGASSADAENNASSSSLVFLEASDEGETDGGAGKIFGLAISGRREECLSAESEPAMVTHQFFPLGDQEDARDCGGPHGSAWPPLPPPPPPPSSHWAGVRFCHSSERVVLGKPAEVPQPVKKSRRGPRSRSSQYRGVTFYRRTGRWESHICNLTKEEFVHVLRRQSTGLPRGSSKYRGVTLHKCGRWEARIGQFLGKKYTAASIASLRSLSPVRMLFNIHFFRQIRVSRPLRH
ncbi:hypothetical protein BHE74_00003424 [Ensete ventricosum]|nr:hypothetical protein BHE74_00003424 [Ensete ventricosum]